MEGQNSAFIFSLWRVQHLGCFPVWYRPQFGRSMGIGWVSSLWETLDEEHDENPGLKGTLQTFFYQPAENKMQGNTTGWWFGTCFFHILGIVILFQMGWNHQPDKIGRKKPCVPWCDATSPSSWAKEVGRYAGQCHEARRWTRGCNWTGFI